MNRILNIREAAALRAMIEHAGDIGGHEIPESLRANLIAQLPSIRAWRRCGCGTCPSIELGDEDAAAPAIGERWVLAAVTNDAGLLLFIDDGKLSYLELYPIEETGSFGEFPPVSEISF